MAKEGIHVFVRVRPPISDDINYEPATSVDNGDTTITLVDEKHNITCSYEHVFRETASQDDVFERVVPLLNDVLNGVNGCIFAYGQTSAGKTHTMLGKNGGADLEENSNDWGILPRSAEYLFKELARKEKDGSLLKFDVKASFLQLYNECIYDLLTNQVQPTINHNNSNEVNELRNEEGRSDAGLKIRELYAGGRRRSNTNARELCEVYVSGLSEYRVQSAQDVLQLLAVGSNNRATRATSFNESSSRSHAILTMSLELTFGEGGNSAIYKGKLHMVDLAGSEKMYNTNSGAPGSAAGRDSPSAAHVRELTTINKSLHSLGNVIEKLSNRSKNTNPDREIHVPYRDSKLTRLLQDSLGGNTRTILLACVAPTVLHTAETISTLSFADRAKNVMLKVKANIVVDDKALLVKAQGEIARLKALLKQTLAQAEAGGGPVDVDAAEQAVQVLQLQKTVQVLSRENKELQAALNSVKMGGGRRGGGKPPKNRDAYRQSSRSTNGSGGGGNGNRGYGGYSSYEQDSDYQAYGEDNDDDEEEVDGGVPQLRPLQGAQAPQHFRSLSGSQYPVEHPGPQQPGPLFPSVVRQAQAGAGRGGGGGRKTKARQRGSLDDEDPMVSLRQPNPNRSAMQDDDMDARVVNKLREKLKQARTLDERNRVGKQLAAVSVSTDLALKKHEQELLRIQQMKQALEQQMRASGGLSSLNAVPGTGRSGHVPSTGSSGHRPDPEGFAEYEEDGDGYGDESFEQDDVVLGAGRSPAGRDHPRMLEVDRTLTEENEEEEEVDQSAELEARLRAVLSNQFNATDEFGNDSPGFKPQVFSSKGELVAGPGSEAGSFVPLHSEAFSHTKEAASVPLSYAYGPNGEVILKAAPSTEEATKHAVHTYKPTEAAMDVEPHPAADTTHLFHQALPSQPERVATGRSMAASEASASVPFSSPAASAATMSHSPTPAAPASIAAAAATGTGALSASDQTALSALQKVAQNIKSATIASKPAETVAAPSEDRSKNPASLCFSKSDIKGQVQLFSFKLDTWETYNIIDFDTNKQLHKVMHVSSKDSPENNKWLDLRKKPVKKVGGIGGEAE